jgi:hypothetical protein
MENEFARSRPNAFPAPPIHSATPHRDRAADFALERDRAGVAAVRAGFGDLRHDLLRGKRSLLLPGRKES